MADKGRVIRLCINEEQQILKEAYRLFFQSCPKIKLVELIDDADGDRLEEEVAALKPDVMLLGFKILQEASISKLKVVRNSSPNTAIVVLTANYTGNGIKALKEFCRDTSSGLAFLLKHTLDALEELAEVIQFVAKRGRLILDPAVVDAFLTTAGHKSAMLNNLAPREMEILRWMAEGYQNNAIAQMLSLDHKTIERHISNIYSKLDTPESKHERVEAVMQYLRTVGTLPTHDFNGD